MSQVDSQIEKDKDGYYFECVLREYAPELFGGLSDKDLEKKLREAKVLRKNQGEFDLGKLTVRGTTDMVVRKVLGRLNEYIFEEELDFKTQPPQVTHEERLSAGSCVFCTSRTRLVWVIRAYNIKTRFCDNCYTAIVKQVQEMKKLGR
jgi:hypothetical protein